MFIILGGTGHVGSATTTALLERGQQLTIVTREEAKGQVWRERGAKIAIADVREPDRLREIFRTGRRAFLLNPPAAPDTDTDAVERASVRCILQGLDGSGLEQVVAQSTYGAQPGERLGDLNTLHDLEAGLTAQPIPFSIIRGAYHFSNWDNFLPIVRETCALPSMLPTDLKLPMVAAEDLGRVTADLLMETCSSNRTVHVEGPTCYSPREVAQAFAEALRRKVVVVEVPRAEWEAAYRAAGFSAAAAHSYARMTAIAADGSYGKPEHPIRGIVRLEDHVNRLIAAAGD